MTVFSAAPQPIPPHKPKRCGKGQHHKDRSQHHPKAAAHVVLVLMSGDGRRQLLAVLLYLSKRLHGFRREQTRCLGVRQHGANRVIGLALGPFQGRIGRKSQRRRPRPQGPVAIRLNLASQDGVVSFLLLRGSAQCSCSRPSASCNLYREPVEPLAPIGSCRRSIRVAMMSASSPSQTRAAAATAVPIARRRRGGAASARRRRSRRVS